MQDSLGVFGVEPEELLAKISLMPEHERKSILALLNAYSSAMETEACKTDFLSFVRKMWPAFISGRHHAIMAKAFERVASGELKRLIINMPPRHTKSEFASYLLPAWVLGLNPSKKIIQAAHTAELSVGFGRKVRNLVDSDAYKEVFPNTKLAVDNKAAGRWNTNSTGEYFAIGVGGAVTGKGADLLIIDDCHALEISTPIATSKGFVALGALRVGDKVFGPDGAAVRVTSKSRVYHDRPLYAVTTYDGETIYADAGHLWNVRTSTRVADPYRNLTTEELIASKSSAFMLPRHAAVQYPVRELPIDPWVLGAWLGDGTSSLGRMTAHPDDAVFIRREFERRGYATTDLADKFSFGIPKLRGQLRALGVLNTKHIPEEYMTASLLQRMDLLCGLIDADGNVTAQGQSVFHNKDRALVDKVVELLHSLGRKCQRRSYLCKTTFGTCTMHRVTFKLKDSALMPRKRERTKTTNDKQHRSITVQKTELLGDVQCITVEREDGLFLAGRGYVVTHNSEQEAAIAAVDPSVFDRTYEWYTSGPRQRLQPGGAIVLVMTRWSKKDLTGRILDASDKRDGMDKWEVIEFPAIMPSGKPLWPEYWSLDLLESLKAELPLAKWQAQYQQAPTSEEGALIKREWWRPWEKKDPPKVEYLIMSVDTAFLKTERADYSACTVWGVFYNDDNKSGKTMPNVILLDAWQERLEFPALKKRVYEEYKRWNPESFLVEGKAAGMPLIFELRQLGIPVEEYTPSKGNDKISRVNAVASLFSSGMVWAPSTRWAEEVIEQCAEFPSGEHDDLVDTVSQALLRYRRGGFIRSPDDYIEETTIPKRAEFY